MNSAPSINSLKSNMKGLNRKRKGGMNYAIILAGGIGSRFWPLSTAGEPKQFLSLYSHAPMIEETIRRVKGLIKKENIYIATNKIYKRSMKKYVMAYGLSWKNILLEPEGKNTFAPIAVLSEKINRMDKDAVIAVLPCDHFIKERGIFLKLLYGAINIAAKGKIVTLGIPPDRPETGYGYIKIKSGSFSKRNGAFVAGLRPEQKVYSVDRFIEKPDFATAKKFLRDKRYYWNGGIFIFRSSVILSEIMRLLPSVYKIVGKINDNNNPGRLWHKMPSTSIDYAVMENTRKIVVLVSCCGWKDMGSLERVAEVTKKDKNGNIFKGNCVDIDTSDTIVWSPDKLVATVGLNNLIIVNTEDALLVCSRDRAQEVRKIAEILKRRGFKNKLG